MKTIGANDIPGLFQTLDTVFTEKRDELIALDAKVGDSDLGITMQKAFAAANETVMAAQGEDLDKIFKRAGAAMAKAAPSTMGTLTATGFMRGGGALAGISAIGTPELARFWRAYADGVAERGKARLGDKTVLDVLVPIAGSLGESAQADMDLSTALARASEAASQALDATKALVAQHGKAAAFRDKSKGLQDAGGTVAYLIIAAFRDFVVSG